MKKSIAIVLPRGEAIRNFLYTGIIHELRKQYRIILFAVVPNARIEAMLRAEADLFYELQSLTLGYPTRITMEIADLAHNRYLWSEASRVRWNMRDVEAVGMRSRVVRTLKKTLARSLANAGSLQWLDNRLLSLAPRERLVHHYQKLLSAAKPDLIFNASHVHAANAYPLLQAARLRGIPTASFLFSWDNLTSQGRVFPQTDYFFAWNQQIRQDLLRIYPNIKPGQVFNTGTPQFMFHFLPQFTMEREAFLKLLGLGPHDRYVLYSSGMSHHMPFEPEVTERIADMLPALDPKLKMVVRTYAKDKGAVYESLKARRRDIIIPDVAWEPRFQTPLPEDMAFYSNLLRHCELGINVASTVSLELCMFDKPAINVGYNPPGRNIYPYDYTRFYGFDHYRPVVESGAVSVAQDEAGMKALIAEYLRNPGFRSEERQALIRKFFELDAAPQKLSDSGCLLQAFDEIMAARQ